MCPTLSNAAGFIPRWGRFWVQVTETEKGGGRVREKSGSEIGAAFCCFYDHENLRKHQNWLYWTNSRLWRESPAFEKDRTLYRRFICTLKWLIFYLLPNKRYFDNWIILWKCLSQGSNFSSISKHDIQAIFRRESIFFDGSGFTLNTFKWLIVKE